MGYDCVKEEKQHVFYNINIEIENLFDINKLYPLDLKKILNERKIKVSPYA